MSRLQLPKPYLLFLGDVTEAPYAKTAFGLRDWAGKLCIGEYALPGTSLTTGLRRLTPAQARSEGARAVVIGAAPRGGALSETWIPPLVEAMEAGLDVISGMHARLADTPALKEAAESNGRRLIDVRRPAGPFPVATGRKRTGQRLLTVGTDCGLGKKYTALSIARAFRARGLDAHFRATGQTGILIAGEGVPIDAVVSDFIAGAAEVLSPDAAAGHWDVIEGQGSLFHPSYAGVSLGLLHGSQPDVLVVCHDTTRTRVLGLPDFALPTLHEAIQLHLQMASRTNPAVRCAGISLNTSALSEPQARALMEDHASRLGLPCADPIRGGAEFDALVDACLGTQTKSVRGV